MTKITCNRNEPKKELVHCKDLKRGEFAVIVDKDGSGFNGFMDDVVISNGCSKLTVICSTIPENIGCRLADEDYLVQRISKVHIEHWME